MAHDVLVERFARHGLAYYQARNQLDQDRLATLQPDDPARLPILDDLGVDHERLGNSAGAVDLLRAKLAMQQARQVEGRDLYTTYANLGTFLIHASMTRAMAGDAAARDQFREGIDCIRQSVAVNPAAHFGRERWQNAIAEFLLAAMANPDLLKRFDCLGNRLNLDIESILNREANWVDLNYGRANTAAFGQWHAADEVPEFFAGSGAVDDPARWGTLNPIRQFITKIGAEEGWAAVDVPSFRQPVPFDEPMLGIIGMWRQGGGANPHFALAIGETMLRVGQRTIAWEAFERANLLADRFWPDPTLQAFLREHCRNRQAAIETTWSFQPDRATTRTPWQQVSPPRSTDNAEHRRSLFRDELAYGQAYQDRFQKYESERIDAGISPDDPRLDRGFPPGPFPIASPVGPEEWYEAVTRQAIAAYAPEHQFARGLLGAGIGSVGVALLFRIRDVTRRRRPIDPATDSDEPQLYP